LVDRTEGLLEDFYVEADAVRKLVVRSLREGAVLRLQLIEDCASAVLRAAQAIYKTLQRGGKILLFGNGGSAADARRIAAEFVGRFARKRGPLPGMALTTNTSILSALGNDYGFEQIFARQVRALGRRGDVAIVISTAGRSPNVIEGARAARKLGFRARIQECFIALGHILCEITDVLLDARGNAGRARSFS
jgi:D-sedoheptulose 7-phosphate isomerase